MTTTTITPLEQSDFPLLTQTRPPENKSDVLRPAQETEAIQGATRPAVSPTQARKSGKDKTLAERLFDIRTVYIEPAAESFARTGQILERFPHAEQVQVAAHNHIPGLFGNEGQARDWIQNKRGVLVLGVKKSLFARPNTRSSDFVAPSHANGCGAACAYCYVPRHKGFANPITTFVNIEQILGYVERHAKRQGEKPTPNQVDERYWTYDIGENSDCSGDALVCDNVRDMVGLFARLPNAKATFATKFVNRDLLMYDPQQKTRLRFSLMPAKMARLLDVRTSPVPERIKAMNDFVEAGYEVHLNFSPVVVDEGYLDEYTQLFLEIDDTLSPKAKAQLACEVIFLTHNDKLHDVNVQWHPRAEQVLWRPDIQQAKISETGGRNVRYKNGFKGQQVRALTDLLEKYLPYCAIRYAF